MLERDDAGRGTRVEFHVSGLGRRVRYVLAYDFADAPAAFSWSLVEGDMLRALDGRYAFAPTDDGTRVDYTLRVDLAVPMPGLVKRRASGMIMGNALRDLKRTVEATGGERGDDRGGAGLPDDEPTPEADVQDPTPGATSGPTAAPTTPPTPTAPRVPHPDAVPFDDAGTEERPLPPPSILESVLTELLGAVPGGEGPRHAGGRRAPRRGEGADRRRRPRRPPAARRRVTGRPRGA